VSVPPRMPDAPVSRKTWAPLAPVARVLYLHGFASSPESTKASYLGSRLVDRGLAFRCPDLNEPAFASLTMTRMLAQVDRELDVLAGPSAVIGSSLGGALAILAAARWPDRVARLVLLAPAVMFGKPGHHLLPPERIDAWRRDGSLAVFHYAAGEERRLGFEFYEDSLRYDVFGTTFDQPCLAFQGTRDASVEPAGVEAFSRTRPNVSLVLLDDDHQLTTSLPLVWKGIETFFGV
jgi:pimeloyl-ACP methyl ester carboxylesterase